MLDQPISKAIAANRRKAQVEVVAPLVWLVSFAAAAPKVGDAVAATALTTDHLGP